MRCLARKACCAKTNKNRIAACLNLRKDGSRRGCLAVQTAVASCSLWVGACMLQFVLPVPPCGSALRAECDKNVSPYRIVPRAGARQHWVENNNLRFPCAFASVGGQHAERLLDDCQVIPSQTGDSCKPGWNVGRLSSPPCVAISLLHACGVFINATSCAILSCSCRRALPCIRETCNLFQNGGLCQHADACSVPSTPGTSEDGDLRQIADGVRPKHIQATGASGRPVKDVLLVTSPSSRVQRFHDQ